MSPKHKTATLPRQITRAGGAVRQGAGAQPAAKKPDRFLAVLVIASIAVGLYLVWLA